jgi:dTDP-4-dehydrorhamnose 3,5-epimerase
MPPLERERDVIDGVVLSELVTHSDERGFFREIVRVTDETFNEGFGQWSHSLMFDGVIKAWHHHLRQTDWWYVATGVLRVGLHDLRTDSSTYGRTMDFIMGDLQPARLLKVPPGVAHGCKTVQGPVNLFYVTSRVYDPGDELRIRHDDPTIGFDWLRSAPIS